MNWSLAFKNLIFKDFDESSQTGSLSLQVESRIISWWEFFILLLLKNAFTNKDILHTSMTVVILNKTQLKRYK